MNLDTTTTIKPTQTYDKEQHKSKFEEFLSEELLKKNSTIVTKEKYEKILSYLIIKRDENLKGDSKLYKAEYQIVKRQEFQLLNLPESGIENFIVKSEKNITKKLPYMEKFFEIIYTNHVKESCHRGVRATQGINLYKFCISYIYLILI